MYHNFFALNKPVVCQNFLPFYFVYTNLRVLFLFPDIAYVVSYWFVRLHSGLVLNKPNVKRLSLLGPHPEFVSLLFLELGDLYV